MKLEVKIKAIPIAIGKVKVSFRNIVPHKVPKAGTKNVTVVVFIGPTVFIKLKYKSIATPEHKTPKNITAIQH